MGMKDAIGGDAVDVSRSGHSFHVSSYFTLASPGTNYFQIKTDSKEVVILEYAFVTNTEAVRFSALEAPTITDGTNAITALNLNRKSSNTATVLLYSNPTSISGGTTLVDTVTPAGSSKTGGSVDGHDAWTLKANTSYVVKVENLGNSNTVCTFNMTWLES